MRKGTGDVRKGTGDVRKGTGDVRKETGINMIWGPGWQKPE